MDSQEDTSALQHPQQRAHNSYSAAIDGFDDIAHEQLPASTAAPLLRQAGRLEPDAQDGSHSSSAPLAAVSAPQAATQQQDEVAAGAALPHGGSSGSGNSSGGRGRSGHHPDMTELQAQVGYLHFLTQDYTINTNPSSTRYIMLTCWMCPYMRPPINATMWTECC